jgi:hypothetical protein
MVALGGKFTEAGVCTPSGSEIIIDAAAVPAMCHHVEGFTRGLGGSIHGAGVAQEEGMEHAYGFCGIPIGNCDRKNGASLRVKVKTDSKEVGSWVNHS